MGAYASIHEPGVSRVKPPPARMPVWQRSGHAKEEERIMSLLRCAKVRPTDDVERNKLTAKVATMLIRFVVDKRHVRSPLTLVCPRLLALAASSMDELQAVDTMTRLGGRAAFVRWAEKQHQTWARAESAAGPTVVERRAAHAQRLFEKYNAQAERASRLADKWAQKVRYYERKGVL